MTEYRLLALDLDGTAVANGQLPTARVRAAVSTALARGVHVAVATGRPFASGLRFAEALGLHAPMICFQGAMVREMAGERSVLYARTLPTDPAAELVALLAHSAFEVTLYTEETLYRGDTRYPAEFWDLWFGLDSETVPDLAQVVERAESGRAPLIKSLVIGEAAACDRLVPELRARFAGRLDVVRSHPLFVELTAPGVSKGNALAFLANHLGVRREQTIAAGDSGNDVSMVEWAGLGVAMANATPELLSVADWVAPPVGEDGIAELVARFVSGNGNGS